MNKKQATVNLDNWRNTPSTKNRVATKTDVDNGNAVFVVENLKPNEVKPYKIDLPKLAYWKDVDTENKQLVIIIQVEETPEGIITGYKDFEGNYGAGFFYEFEVLDEDKIKKMQQ